MILRILIILAIHLYSQVGHTYKDENKPERTYKGFISATLNSDKNIRKQMFVREYFDKFEPTKDSFDFTGDLPILNIEIDIDKNFTAKELKERFNN